VVTLNRPKAVNALTAGMVTAVLEQLTAWADDDTVATVLVQGAAAAACARAGDIVAIYRDILAGGDETAGFWADEYRMNSLIERFPKPYVAFMDGLVLGGGVGISAHGSLRIVTERTRTGMPETTIGFVPDVGGTLLLSRSPGEAGTHAALTGAHLSGADALFLGLADYFVPSGSLAHLAAALGKRECGSRRRTFCRKGARLGAGGTAGLDRRLLFSGRRRGRLSGGCVPPAGRPRRPPTPSRRSRPLPSK
jgi:enoyl-CoA hydratase